MSRGPLRFHADPGVQRPDLPLAPVVHGFFREIESVRSSTPWDRRFIDWWDRAHDYLAPVPLAEAEFGVLAVDWYWIRGGTWRSRTDKDLRQRALLFADRVHAAGRPLVVFFTGDRSHEALPVRDAIVFREGLYRSRLGPRDRAMPAFTEDLVESYCDGRLPLRGWQPEPTVGFCGLAGHRRNLTDWAKLAAYHARGLATQGWADISPYAGENLRAEALDRLSRAGGLRTNFVIRSEGVFFRHADPFALLPVRREYVRNLAESDYVLCCRGSGNYSFRLYETLCMGRIPVFVDTDCVLPCEAEIGWRDCCVWVEESKLDSLPEQVLEHHARLDAASFRDRQLRNREIWLEYLAPRSFFSRMLPQQQ
jgi:hypothetical protein